MTGHSSWVSWIRYLYEMGSGVFDTRAAWSRLSNEIIETCTQKIDELRIDHETMTWLHAENQK